MQRQLSRRGTTQSARAQLLEATSKRTRNRQTDSQRQEHLDNKLFNYQLISFFIHIGIAIFVFIDDTHLN
jgi:hypothetical protein